MLHRELEPKRPSAMPAIALGMLSFGLATIASALFMALVSGGC